MLSSIHMEMHYFTFATAFPVGTLTLAATARGLAVLSFRGIEEYRGKTGLKEVNWIESRKEVEPYFDKVDKYLRGESRDLEMRLDLRGTDFQLKCWNALLQIPFGETRSYGQMAEVVECPKGFRAVGLANNRNPVAIVVPCHRVIETNGKLGGYGGGLPAKEWLLNLEGAPLRALAARLF
ncbi:MAG TPA: methylated-DNA--[protein]-cysteine S-methyltransferase [Terriglobales bacterium]|nr:methylated-DNA--[protein]-cysteine S-methyltransferase [Terriglobales bacterium]